MIGIEFALGHAQMVIPALLFMELMALMAVPPIGAATQTAAGVIDREVADDHSVRDGIAHSF